MITLKHDGRPDGIKGHPQMHKVGGKWVYDGFVVIKIEEFNFYDKILKQTNRFYRIHWKDEDKKIKCFDCILGEDTYNRFVVPNITKVEVMNERRSERKQ